MTPNIRRNPHAPTTYLALVEAGSGNAVSKPSLQVPKPLPRPRETDAGDVLFTRRSVAPTPLVLVAIDTSWITRPNGRDTVPIMVSTRMTSKRASFDDSQISGLKPVASPAKEIPRVPEEKK